MIVPTDDALATRGDAERGQAAHRRALQSVAREAGLQSYEIPRDFLVETRPFTLENGLLTGIRKLARPQLKERYGDRTRAALHRAGRRPGRRPADAAPDGANRPVLETVSRAAVALLGAASSDAAPDAQFTDLGGDSLSALTFANLLHEIFGCRRAGRRDRQPGQRPAGHRRLRRGQRPAGKRPTLRRGARPRRHRGACQRPDAGQVHRRGHPGRRTGAARPGREVRTVLLTGATGFLGRYLALEWLERMDLVDGKVIAWSAPSRRGGAGAPGRDLRQRRPEAARPLPELAADHLEVIAGDKGEANLGLDAGDLAAAGRHRRPDRRPGRPGQPRAALQPAVRPQRRRHRRADPDRADHARSSRSPTSRRSAWATRSSPGSSSRTPTSGRSAPPADRRQLRQRLRQQQVGRRGAAARGARPVRPAGRGVPLRHDPGRHHLRGTAQRAGHVHPA